MLEAVQITKAYRKKAVLHEASFALRPGEILGVAGHNGSGKSTLLSIVAQVARPTSGAIRCDGRDVLGDRYFLRTMLGYVPQKNSLLPDLTVQETLRFWQRTYGFSGDVFAPNAICTDMGLQPLAKKRVDTLSGGMQKRLSVALALMHSPRFLLLDEVFPALDRHYRTALNNRILQAKAQGCGILYCSHEVEDLTSFCDNILVLRSGRTAFYGPAATFPTDGAALDELMNPLLNRAKEGTL